MVAKACVWFSQSKPVVVVELSCVSFLSALPRQRRVGRRKGRDAERMS